MPASKDEARENVVSALSEGGRQATTLAVRVNDLTTAWTYRDVVAVVGGAGRALDSMILPKVESAQHVWWHDVLLTQLERAKAWRSGPAVGLAPGR